MSSTHTVVIVATHNGYLVRPSSVVAGRTDSLRFVNLTMMSCQIFVPRFSFFGNNGLNQAIDPGDDFTQAIDAGERRGAFPYQIYLFTPTGGPVLAEHRLFAVGESAPHVIIE